MSCHISEYSESFLKHTMWYLMVSKKTNILFMRGLDRKFVPRDHRLASLVMPNGDRRDGPHTHDRFL